LARYRSPDNGETVHSGTSPALPFRNSPARFEPMMSHVRFRRLPALSCSLIASLMLSGCSDKPRNPASAGGKGGGAAPVLVGQVLRQNVPLVIEAIGAVEPIRMTADRAQVTGTLEKTAFNEGQEVKQGDLLFQIDPRP